MLPPERLIHELFWACHTRRSPWGDPGDAGEIIGAPTGNPEAIVVHFCSDCRPRDADPDKQQIIHGWIDGQYLTQGRSTGLNQ